MPWLAHTPRGGVKQGAQQGVKAGMRLLWGVTATL